MKIKIGKWNLVNDEEVKVIPDGFEIFASAVKTHGILPEDFENAYWQDGSIIVEKGRKT